MPTMRGRAEWPGVKGFVSCSYTCSWGVTPGRAELEIATLEQVAEVGDLVLSDGVNPPLRLPGCKVVEAVGQRTGTPDD